MARIKNGSFVGTSPFDVDVEALTFRRVIKNISADTARIFDRVTGEHSHTAADTINHDGTDGNGSLLGYPLAQQWIGKSIRPAYTGGVTSGSKDGGAGPTWLIAVPVFIPPGETQLAVEVVADLRHTNPRAYFRSLAWATIGLDEFVELVPSSDGSRVFTARFSALTSGLALFFVEIDTGQQLAGDPSCELTSWRLYSDRQRASIMHPRSAAGDIPVTPPSTPSATEGVANIAFDASLYVDTAPLHAYLTARENQNQTGLIEYVTGYPAGGAAAYVHVDHDGAGVADAINPARSRFMAHTRSLYAAEPRVAMPLTSMAFGATHTDGSNVVDNTEPPVGGMLGWYALWPTSGANTVCAQWECAVPDFNFSMEFAVLVSSDLGDITDWDGSCGQAGGALRPFVAVTGVPGSTVLAVARSGGGIRASTTPDTLQEFQVNLVKTRSVGAARGIKSIRLLGAANWFEP